MKDGTTATLMKALVATTQANVPFGVMTQFDTRMSKKVPMGTIQIVIETSPDVTGGNF